MRVLMVGGGGRGLALTRTLTGEGHAVRAVTRSERNRAAIEAAGAECWIGDPNVVGTLRYAFDNATVLLWLLGTVQVEALHGSRLAMALERTVDTTVRGVVYEGTGAGAEVVRRAHDTHGIPYRLLEADPTDAGGWARRARAAIDDVLRPAEA